MVVQKHALKVSTDVVRMVKRPQEDRIKKVVLVNTRSTAVVLTVKLPRWDQIMKDVMTADMLNTVVVRTAKQKPLDQTMQDVLQLQWLHSYLVALWLLRRSLHARCLKTKELFAIQDINSYGSTIPQKVVVRSSGMVAVRATTIALQLKINAKQFVWNHRRKVVVIYQKWKVHSVVLSCRHVTGTTTRPDNAEHSGGVAV